MRGRFIIPAVAAGFAAVIFAAPTTASSFPVATTLDYGQSNAGLVEDVARRYRYSRKVNKRNSLQPYAYRSQPYGYRSRPYGYRSQPYAYRYQPYGYSNPYGYRRPGISLRFGL
jgi:hypothetical protein